MIEMNRTNEYTELRDMPFGELVGVVNSYPWFAAAQKALGYQMGRLGGKELSRRQYADAALHAASRGTVAALLREEFTCTDGDIAELLKKYVAPEEADEAPEEGAPEGAEPDGPDARTVGSSFRGVGDYFSREQYEAVRRGGDSWTRPSPAQGGEQAAADLPEEAAMDEFCTAAIAKIYEEQGYFDRAKQIYAKLILKYPEKSTYFASLIEKLNVR